MERYKKYFDTDLGTSVAKKWIPYGSTEDGLPCSILREISALKKLSHWSVVRLLNVIPEDEGVYLDFEHLDLDLDLHSYIYESDRQLDPDEIKAILVQILQGVFYCHSRKVMHRDLTPHKVLIDKDSKIVKLADFGFARTVDVPRRYSTEVTTLAYRAPELLLGTPYSTAVDIWSVGCIFAEMVLKDHIFNGITPAAVMTKILRKFGLPDERDWPGVTEAARNLFKESPLPEQIPPDFASDFPHLDPQGYKLLTQMLHVVPSGRITAHDALKHPYFNDLRLKGLI